MNIEMLSPIPPVIPEIPEPEPPSIKLLWKSTLTNERFGATTAKLDLTEYVAVGIAFKYHYEWLQTGYIQIEKGYISNMLLFDVDTKEISATRQVTVSNTGVTFDNCTDWDGTTNNAKCYPFKIYGIRA